MNKGALSTYLSGYIDVDEDAEFFATGEIIYWNHPDFTYRISALRRNWQFLENHFDLLKKAENLRADDFGFPGWEEEFSMSYSETAGFDIEYLPVLHRAGILAQLLTELDELFNIIRRDMVKDGKPLEELEETENLLKDIYQISDMGSIRDSFLKYICGKDDSFRNSAHLLNPEFIREAFREVYHLSLHISKLAS